ncbi:asparagine synthetase B [Ramlibacter sp. WS9]|uniref:asparagine synthetase B family protein n=1 Tax=Ramlibacter sp. WS9 TaxID=1882741 RepID=UPI001141E867|nr:asparagine synthase-related protein [Ramlibacter sp. WS9]ROZ66376.1 asparagine synthetase B [Ramlibacter sp. WS9]
MSCIAGLLDRAGKPIDPQWLHRMLARMKARAPDGDQVVCDGPVGFGHALLRTGSSGAEAGYAISTDRQVWITADARIDGRADLIRELRAAGRRVENDAPHAELIVESYCAFGEEFLSHLIGDFAFALWDERSAKLICARDHFGVRPFHYVQAGDVFAFASDLDALLAIPQVSDELNEASVVDFLLFGAFQDAGSSIYRDIKCLPPATALTITTSHSTQRRYWELPRHAETRFRRRSEYVEQFDELFKVAVCDRLPDGAVAMQLSGGMDSTAIAAVTAGRLTASKSAITAYTICSHSLLPEDQERHFAEMVASELGIRLVSQDLGKYELFEGRQGAALTTSAPIVYPHLAAHHDTLAQVAETGARVLLSGHGGDAVMAPSASHYPNLMRSGRLVKFAAEVAHHVRGTGSFRGMGLRSALWPPRPTPAWMPPLPDWIDPALAERVDLEARWNAGWQTYHSGVDAYGQLTQPWLSRHFEALEILKQPVVGRYPFYDLRLVQFLLGIPNFMLARKAVLREAMCGKLPEVVRYRPKTALPGDPIRVIVTNRNLDFPKRWKGSNFSKLLCRDKYFIALDNFCNGEGADSTWNTSLIVAPIAFNTWLDSKTGTHEK